MFMGKNTDWTEYQKEQADAQLVKDFGEHVSIPVPKTATRVYNYHSYAFGHTSVWIDNPANFYCTNSDEDHRGGYKTWDDPGTKVYRFNGDEHSAKPGNETLPYKAKCGREPIAYHDSTLYGAHNFVWEHRSYPDCGQ